MDEDDEAPAAPGPVARKGKSSIVEIIEAVGGLSPAKLQWICKHCGHDKCEVFTPLDGGLAIRRCRKCRKRHFFASVRSRMPDALNPGAPANLISPSLNGQSIRGPFVNTPVNRNTDPLRPLSRIKTEKE